MKKIFFTFALTLFTVSTSFAIPQFSDKDQIPGYAEFPIQMLVQKNVLSGNSDGSFRPERQVNRAEFCKMLVIATDSRSYIPLSPSFPDVQKDDWFFEYIETAKHNGWVKGYPDGTFRPGNKINRAEIAKVLVKAFGFEAESEIDSENVQFMKYLGNALGTNSNSNKVVFQWKTPTGPRQIRGHKLTIQDNSHRLNHIEPLLETFFNDYFFVQNLDNSHDGLIDNIQGYEKDDMVCLAKSKRVKSSKNFEIFCGDPEKIGEEAWYEQFVRSMKTQKLLPFGMDTHFFPAKNPTRAEIAEQIFRFMKKTGKISTFDLAQKPQSTEINEIPPTTVEDQTTEPVTTNAQEVPQANLSQTIDPTAGTIVVSKKSGMPKKVAVSQGQRDLAVSRLIVEAKDGPVEITGLQFRRIGNGSHSDFSRAWIEVDNTKVSAQVMITNDLVNIPLNTPLKISSGGNKEISLNIDVSQSARKGSSSRFTLYLPDWIGANTDSKVGFFPFGGVDVDVKE